MEFLSATDIEILDARATCRNALKPEVINVVLCCKEWVNQTKGWKVFTEPSLSDNILTRAQDCYSGGVADFYISNLRWVDWRERRSGAWLENRD